MNMLLRASSMAALIDGRALQRRLGFRVYCVTVRCSAAFEPAWRPGALVDVLGTACSVLLLVACLACAHRMLLSGAWHGRLALGAATGAATCYIGAQALRAKRPCAACAALSDLRCPADVYARAAYHRLVHCLVPLAPRLHALHQRHDGPGCVVVQSYGLGQLVPLLLPGAIVIEASDTCVETTPFAPATHTSDNMHLQYNALRSELHDFMSRTRPRKMERQTQERRTRRPLPKIVLVSRRWPDVTRSFTNRSETMLRDALHRLSPMVHVYTGHEDARRTLTLFADADAIVGFHVRVASACRLHGDSNRVHAFCARQARPACR